MFCFQVNFFPVLCAFLTFSPAFQFPHFPFAPSSHIHIYLEDIKILLNYRIRITVWLQLTLVVVKPLYFLRTTIGGAENIQGHVCGSPSYSVNEQRLSSRKCSTSLCLQRQLQKWQFMTSYEIEGMLDYGIHVFSA